MRVSVWFGIAACFLCLRLSAQPAAVDFGASLEKVLNPSVPGIAAAAWLEGHVVARGVAGVRKLGNSDRVTLQDRFHLGSCTKGMTATVAARLVENGTIGWDTTCGEVFGDIELAPEFHRVTLRQLLTNTGGLPTDVPGPLWQSLEQSAQSGAEQRLDLIRGLLTQSPAYRPGDGYAYSNAGFSVAGAMLERKSGINFPKLIRRELFQPAGMSSASFGAPATPGKIDQPYGHLKVDGKLVPISPGPAADNPAAITPAGRVNATIDDFLKFAVLHLPGSGGGILDDKQREFLHSATKANPGYAAGWVLLERDWGRGTVLTHSGTNTMFYAVMWIAPKRRFAAVAACNSGEGMEACDAAIGALIARFLTE